MGLASGELTPGLLSLVKTQCCILIQYKGRLWCAIQSHDSAKMKDRVLGSDSPRNFWAQGWHGWQLEATTPHLMFLTPFTTGRISQSIFRNHKRKEMVASFTPMALFNFLKSMVLRVFFLFWSYLKICLNIVFTHLIYNCSLVVPVLSQVCYQFLRRNITP